MINLNNYYKLKYLKYKNKYISLQNQYGGATPPPSPPPSPPPPPPPPPPPAKNNVAGVLGAISSGDHMKKLKPAPPPAEPTSPPYDPANDPKEQPSLLSDIVNVKLRKADPTKISKAPQRICVPNRDGGFKTFNLCITANPPK